MTMINAGMGLVPVPNFAQVAGNVYRSAQPDRKVVLPWLEAHGFETVIDLRREAEMFDDELNGGPHPLNIVHVPIEDDHAVDDATLDRLADLIQSAQYRGKVLVHCDHGHGRTSMATLAWLLKYGPLKYGPRFGKPSRPDLLARLERYRQDYGSDFLKPTQLAALLGYETYLANRRARSLERLQKGPSLD